MCLLLGLPRRPLLRWVVLVVVNEVRAVGAHKLLHFAVVEPGANAQRVEALGLGVVLARRAAHAHEESRDLAAAACSSGVHAAQDETVDVLAELGAVVRLELDPRVRAPRLLAEHVRALKVLNHEPLLLALEGRLEVAAQRGAALRRIRAEHLEVLHELEFVAFLVDDLAQQRAPEVERQVREAALRFEHVVADGRQPRRLAAQPRLRVLHPDRHLFPVVAQVQNVEDDVEEVPARFGFVLHGHALVRPEGADLVAHRVPGADLAVEHHVARTDVAPQQRRHRRGVLLRVILRVVPRAHHKFRAFLVQQHALAVELDVADEGLALETLEHGVELLAALAEPRGEHALKGPRHVDDVLLREESSLRVAADVLADVAQVKGTRQKSLRFGVVAPEDGLVAQVNFHAALEHDAQEPLELQRTQLTDELPQQIYLPVARKHHFGLRGASLLARENVQLLVDLAEGVRGRPARAALLHEVGGAAGKIRRDPRHWVVAARVGRRHLRPLVVLERPFPTARLGPVHGLADELRERRFLEAVGGAVAVHLRQHEP
mmetsp:Transcript_72/g.243  ORF Transcript_72/g.243 Transcript_72/m.243 type:complete len:547 (+) Transcript_72:1488-3128(+)